MYFEYKNAEKYPGFHRSIGNTFFTAISYNSGFRYSIYVLGFALTTFLVFIQYSSYKVYPFDLQPWTVGVNAIFNGFSRQFFCIGLALIISPVFAGKGSLLRYLLGGHFWVPLARLSFSGYLVHLLIF